MVIERHILAAHGVTYYGFTAPGTRLLHAIFTRLGGVSRAPFASLNLGGKVGDEPQAVADNHQRIYDCLGLTEQQVVSAQQVHSARVAYITDSAITVIPETDALITNVPHIAFLLRFADCVPVLLYDALHHAIGLAHAGWRGIVSGIIPATVQAMMHEFGSDPQDLWAGIGPAIEFHHYAVGTEVAGAIQGSVAKGMEVVKQLKGQWYADLPGAADAQLCQCGVGKIDRAALCTACHTDEWYSHRAENGKTGRFGVLMMLR